MAEDVVRLVRRQAVVVETVLAATSGDLARPRLEVQPHVAGDEALRLVDEGASVVISDVNPDGLADTEAYASKQRAGAVHAITGDVADPALAEQLVAEAHGRFGGVDVLANVAGILHTAITHEHDLDMWTRVLTINLTGTLDNVGATFRVGGVAGA